MTDILKCDMWLYSILQFICNIQIVTYLDWFWSTKDCYNKTCILLQLYLRQLFSSLMISKVFIIISIYSSYIWKCLNKASKNLKESTPIYSVKLYLRNKTFKQVQNIKQQNWPFKDLKKIYRYLGIYYLEVMGYQLE